MPETQGFARGLLFDLDGTLVDSAPDLAAALGAALADFGCPAPALPQVRGWIGYGTRALVVEAWRAAEGWAPPLDALLRRFNHHYAKCNGRYSVVLPAVRETLALLAQRRVPMAVVSNKDGAFARALLQAHDLERYFGAAVYGDCLDRKKPDASMLHLALRELGLLPREALLVGDSEIDVSAGRNAGVAVWLLREGYRRGADAEALGADRVIERIDSVSEALVASLPQRAPAAGALEPEPPKRHPPADGDPTWP